MVTTLLQPLTVRIICKDLIKILVGLHYAPILRCSYRAKIMIIALMLITAASHYILSTLRDVAMYENIHVELSVLWICGVFFVLLILVRLYDYIPKRRLGRTREVPFLEICGHCEYRIDSRGQKIFCPECGSHYQGDCLRAYWKQYYVGTLGSSIALSMQMMKRKKVLNGMFILSMFLVMVLVIVDKNAGIIASIALCSTLYLAFEMGGRAMNHAISRREYSCKSCGDILVRGDQLLVCPKCKREYDESKIRAYWLENVGIHWDINVSSTAEINKR